MRTPSSPTSLGARGRGGRATLFLCPLIDPVVDGLVPELRVLRLKYPVAFVGEVKHLRGDTHGLKRREQLEAFAHVEPVVELSVNHEGWRLETGSGVARRPLVVHRAVRVRRPFELPIVEPEFFGRAPRRN